MEAIETMRYKKSPFFKLSKILKTKLLENNTVLERKKEYLREKRQNRLKSFKN